MNKLVLPILALLALVPIAAFADNTYYDLSNTYTVHLAHVGDYIFINNTDATPHTIIGTDGQGYEVDTTIPSTAQTELHFLFPGQFTFYDPANCNVGIFYVYEIGTNLTTINVYNHTSTNDLYHRPACTNTSTQPMPIVQNTTNTTTSAPIVDNGGSTQNNLSFTGTSNATENLTFQESNATYWQGQAQYWQNQSNTWENKYNALNGLLASIKSLLG